MQHFYLNMTGLFILPVWTQWYADCTNDELTGWTLTRRRFGRDCWRRVECWTVALSSPRSRARLETTKRQHTHTNTNTHLVSGLHRSSAVRSWGAEVTKRKCVVAVMHKEEARGAMPQEKKLLTLLSIIRIRVWPARKDRQWHREGGRDVWRRRRRQEGQSWVQSKRKNNNLKAEL